ncbi:MAG: phage major tail protein, TP901-1 family [Bacteroidaceae bacterium]|nr:phage major tail protein, TP901-1 family [Bacteroidaceae bacterium]
MMNLQLFAAEAVKGSKIIYLYRILSEAATNDAVTIMFTTEDSISMSKDSDSTVTKDGTIRTPGALEVEKTGTSILVKGDTMYAKLKNAMINDELVEIWEVNLDEPAEGGNNKFKGTYYQGYLTEFEKTASAEDYVECSTTFAINGSGADGDVTVTAEQQEMASYVFKDTQKTGA